MKRFFVAAALLLLSGQAFGQLVITQKKEEPIEKEKSSTSSFLDFRPYTTNGFFISTASYFGEYTPIGILNMRFDPETVKNKNRKISDPLYLVEEIPAQEVLNAAVETAKKMGADGIMDFKFTTVEYTSAGETAIFPPIRYYLITGLCISRNTAGDE